MATYRNEPQPHKIVEEFVDKDLINYDQSNPYPKSLTIVDADGSWRHYELGEIFGFLICGTKKCDGSFNIVFTVVREDDEMWYAPNNPTLSSAAWINTAYNTLKRAKNWYNEHIFEGWKENEGHWGDPEWYHIDIIKEIKPEIIKRQIRED